MNNMRLHDTLSGLSVSVKRALEQLEPYIDDPIVEDYCKYLKDVTEELDGTVYAIEQVMTHESGY